MNAQTWLITYLTLDSWKTVLLKYIKMFEFCLFRQQSGELFVGGCHMSALGPSTMGWALPGDAPTLGLWPWREQSCSYNWSDANPRQQRTALEGKRGAGALHSCFCSHPTHKLSHVPRGHSCTWSPSNLQDWIFLAESLAQAQCFIVIKDD